MSFKNIVLTNTFVASRSDDELLATLSSSHINHPVSIASSIQFSPVKPDNSPISLLTFAIAEI